MTRDQAKLIMEAHGILALLDDVLVLEAIEETNPELAEAYFALHRIAYGADPTASRDNERSAFDTLPDDFETGDW